VHGPFPFFCFSIAGPIPLASFLRCRPNPPPSPPFPCRWATASAPAQPIAVTLRHRLSPFCVGRHHLLEARWTCRGAAPTPSCRRVTGLTSPLAPHQSTATDHPRMPPLPSAAVVGHPFDPGQGPSCVPRLEPLRPGPYPPSRPLPPRLFLCAVMPWHSTRHTPCSIRLPHHLVESCPC
jgi:hypothetical protein